MDSSKRVTSVGGDSPKLVKEGRLGACGECTLGVLETTPPWAFVLLPPTRVGQMAWRSFSIN